MALSPSLDKALQNLMGSCSYTAKNSVPSPGFGPELKVMLKIPWVFARAPDLAKYEIVNCEHLVKYFDANRGTYIRFGNCVTTLAIYKETSHDLKVVINLTKTLHIHPSAIALERLQELINNDDELCARLRNVTSTIEFLRLYSDFFRFDDNESVWPLIPCHVDQGLVGPNTKKVNSLMAMELICTYIRQMAPAIKLPQLHANLCSIGFGFSLAELQTFVYRFYHPSHVPKYPLPQPHPARLVKKNSEFIEILRQTLKLWPVSLSKVQKVLVREGYPMEYGALRSRIDRLFPNYIMRFGVMVQDHQPYKATVLSILSDKCPISVIMVFFKVLAHKVVISEDILIEVIVKSLDGYLVCDEQIYLPTCNTTSGEPITDVVLNRLHHILDGNCPVLLDDLIPQLEAKGIFLSRNKLKTMITEHSTSYKYARNFVGKVDPIGAEIKTTDPEFTKSKTTQLGTKAFVDSYKDVKEACTQTENVNVSKEVSEIAKKPRPESRPDNLDVETEAQGPSLTRKLCDLEVNRRKK